MTGCDSPEIRCSGESLSRAGNRIDGGQPFNPHSVPKGHAAFDLDSCILRLRVIPSRAGKDLITNDDIVVGGDALPGTDGLLGALVEVLSIDALKREVMVPLHNDRVIALGRSDVLPGSSEAAAVDSPAGVEKSIENVFECHGIHAAPPRSGYL